MRVCVCVREYGSMAATKINKRAFEVILSFISPPPAVGQPSHTCREFEPAI